MSENQTPREETLESTTATLSNAVTNEGQTDANGNAESPISGANARLAVDEDALKAIITPVVSNTVVSADDFEVLIEAYGLPELTLVMEAFADMKVNRDILRKIQKVKRKFDPLLRSFSGDARKKAADDPLKQEMLETAAAADYRLKNAWQTLSKAREEFEVQDLKDKEENSVKKRSLLDKLKEVVEKQEVTALEAVRNIQDEWKKIGQVKQEDMDTIYQAYKENLDKFYDMRKKYVALIEIDRQVNLEKKESLIKEAYSLIPKFDHTWDVESNEYKNYFTPEYIAELSKELPRNFWQETGDKVKALHESWKQTGAVSREKSDEVWNQFKYATDQFYNAKRLFFGILDGERDNNAKIKQELLETARPFAHANYDKVDDWRDNANILIELRNKWNETGAAPQEINGTLNETFRKICDDFFDSRKKFLEVLDAQKDELEKIKMALVEEAEALKDSEDWRTTTDKLIELQKKWNESGDDNFREGRKLRKRFRKACDAFFRRKGSHVQTIQDAENKALQVKVDLAERIEAAVENVKANGITDAPIAAAALIEMRENFNAAGRVPMKEKEKIAVRFNATFNEYLNLIVPDASERKRLLGVGGGGRSGGSGGGRGEELDLLALQKKLKSIEEKIKLLSNNITFFAKSKSNNPLIEKTQENIRLANEEKVHTEKLIAQLKDLRNKEKQAKNTENKPAATAEPVSVAETTVEAN